MMRSRLGTYIVHLPVDQSFTCEAGATIWGFPKTVQEIDFEVSGQRARCSLVYHGAHALTLSNEIEGTRRVIDFSGDSSYSFGGVPVAQARAAALAAGIVINGLAILCNDCSGRPADHDLEGAFAALITGGPGSFVITADGDQRFAEAVRRKLLLEIAGGSPPGDTLASVKEPGR